MSDQPRQVLLLYAESRFLPAIVEVDAAFRSTVSSGLGAPVIFHTEFLDLPPTPSAAYERRLRDLLRLKYQDVHLDLIMACAAQGAAHRARLPCRAGPRRSDRLHGGGLGRRPRAPAGRHRRSDDPRLDGHPRGRVAAAARDPTRGRGRGNFRARQTLHGLGPGGVCRRAGPSRVHVCDGPAAGSGGGETGRPARWDHRVPGLIPPGQRRSKPLDARGSGADWSRYRGCPSMGSASPSWGTG